MLFRISKISTFESNSQLNKYERLKELGCSEYQRYQLLRAIHNLLWVVFLVIWLFRISKISTFESNSQLERHRVISMKRCSEYQRYQLLRAIHNLFFHTFSAPRVVPNIKDINFWEQFTTIYKNTLQLFLLFRISKISTFESNSQPALPAVFLAARCSEYQRYQLLRAIHNR